VKVSCLLWILQKITLLWGHKWNKTNQWRYFRKGLHVLFPKTNFLIWLNFWIIVFANYYEKCI
jgi:hypothetical protein